MYGSHFYCIGPKTFFSERVFLRAIAPDMEDLP